MDAGATDIAPRDGAATAMESGAQASSLPDAPMGISEDELVAVVFSELFPDSFRCTVPVHDDSKVNPSEPVPLASRPCQVIDRLVPTWRQRD